MKTCIGGVGMNKGEEKCKGTKDKCIDEIYHIMTETSCDECNRFVMEYLNSYNASKRIKAFFISLVI